MTARYGSELTKVDWGALAEAKRERWLEAYRKDPLASVKQIWARGRHARSLIGPDALERARDEDLRHHIELKRLIGEIGDLLG